ncbi:uncharacterized protein LOC132037693 [Lycium ferocissimum]|uniref:uncharacterized protein LOC132037693 n=1 Tax=Lycium ferocissimum TaxID=112874 RepID=UPI002816908C|nr:uncharacterized protein LOC132037693 [Lycium ferocissimum]
MYRIYPRDERAGVDDTWRLHMQQQVQSWDFRMTSLAVVGHDTPIHVYMEWYMRITRIIIGNPSRRRPDGLGYAALARVYEALVRTVQTMHYESTARTEAPETTEYAVRMIELAETGTRQAHDFERVLGAPPGAAGGSGLRGAGGRRRGGRAGRGDEAPSTSEIPPSSYRPATTDIPSTSHSRPSTSQTPLCTPDPFSNYVPWPSFPHLPVRDPQGERPVRDLQGGLHLHFNDSMFEDFVFDTAPSASPAPGAAQEPSHQASQEAVDTQVHSSTPVDPSPASRPTQETVEEPAQEPSHQASQEAVDTQVHSFGPVDPSPAPGPTQEAVEEPAQEPSHQASQEAVDTQV